MTEAVGAKAGAFRRALGRYFGPLQGYVRRRVHQRAAAEGLQLVHLSVEEIVGETIATAFCRYDGRAQGLAFYRWLRQIARGVIGREVARVERQRRREVSLDTPVVPAHRIAAFSLEADLTLADVLPDPRAALPPQEYERAELWRQVDRAFAQLPPAWQEIFLMHAVDGLSLDEVAARQGRPVEAVIHSVSQTREFLRAALREGFDEEDLPSAA